jgi:hypothetical protein
MSYDVYFWYQVTDDVDEVLDELANHNVRSAIPHPSVHTFRRALLDQMSHLIDVIEPEEGSPAEASFVILTLPVDWTTQLPQILGLSARHGLSGWDPQTNEPLGQQETRTTRPSPLSVLGHDPAVWTADRLAGLGIGTRSIARAWSLAELPQQVSFGQAVGVFILAMAMRDGVSVNTEEARKAVDAVTAHCADGIPSSFVTVDIGYTTTDVTGFASAIARGNWD